MLDSPYLIAIALIEQEGHRKIPLTGKSLASAIGSNESPFPFGESLIQQLLIRVFQLSGEKYIKRCFGEKSLLLIQIPMYEMQDKIPLIKSEWINNGDSEKFLSELKNICEGVWKIYFTREEGIQCKKIS